MVTVLFSAIIVITTPKLCQLMDAPVRTVERTGTQDEHQTSPHSPTVFGVTDFMASPGHFNSTQQTPLHEEADRSPRRPSSVHYDHYDSPTYQYLTTAFRVICIITACASSIMCAFNLLMLIVSHIETLSTWKFIQELFQSIISLTGVIFSYIAIYSTLFTVPRNKRKVLSIVSLIGFFIVICLQMFMVFFPFITGMETAPSVGLETFTKWNQKSKLVFDVIVVPLVITLLLGSLFSIIGGIRLFVMIRYDRQGQNVTRMSDELGNENL
jgi:hypothetical protein